MAARLAEGFVRAVAAGEQPSCGLSSADQPGRADHDVTGPDAEELADALGRGVHVGETVGAGEAVGAAGVRDDRPDAPVADDLLAPCDRVALHRLLVKTAAAEASGPSLTSKAMSGRPLGLRPAVTPLARNPFAAVTLTARLRSREARRSRGGQGRCSSTGWRHPRCPL